MTGITKLFLALALVAAGLGGYQWNYYRSIQCEPCLPEAPPCLPCPSENATPVARATLAAEAVLLLGWLVARRKRRA